MPDKDELKIEDLEIGQGDKVKPLDTVIIHYTGWLSDSGKIGRKFDSSRDRKQPFEVKIGAGYVIKGWDIGVIGMQKGGKRRLTIPHEYAYGKYGVDPVIPGFATLIFELELIDIK